MRIEAFENAAGRGDIQSAGAGSKYFRLQYLRAIAALFVVVFHAAYYLKFIRGDDRILAIIPPNLGGFGVCLFFVISGYLMASLANKTSASRFIVHRIIRIYPIYWLVLIVFFLINRRLGYGFTFDPLAIALRAWRPPELFAWRRVDAAVRIVVLSRRLSHNAGAFAKNFAGHRGGMGRRDRRGVVCAAGPPARPVSAIGGSVDFGMDAAFRRRPSDSLCDTPRSAWRLGAFPGNSVCHLDFGGRPIRARAALACTASRSSFSSPGRWRPARRPEISTDFRY